MHVGIWSVQCCCACVGAALSQAGLAIMVMPAAVYNAALHPLLLRSILICDHVGDVIILAMLCLRAVHGLHAALVGNDHRAVARFLK